MGARFHGIVWIDRRAAKILVKTEVCGVCHTDIHAARGDWPCKPHLAFIPGHEGKVKTDIELQPLSAINAGFKRLEHGDLPGRVVLQLP